MISLLSVARAGRALVRTIIMLTKTIATRFRHAIFTRFEFPLQDRPLFGSGIFFICRILSNKVL
jgi:hypothetical protein